jgi:hypothetical protein
VQHVADDVFVVGKEQFDERIEHWLDLAREDG